MYSGVCTSAWRHRFPLPMATLSEETKVKVKREKDKKKEKGKACVVEKKSRWKETKNAHLCIFVLIYCIRNFNIWITFEGNKYQDLPSFSFSVKISKVGEKRGKEAKAGQETHHVEIGADFDSSGQVPHNAIPIMPRGEKDSWIEGVWLQNKHFVLVTLSLNNMDICIKKKKKL